MIDFVMHKITAGLGESFSQKIVINQNNKKNKKNIEKKYLSLLRFIDIIDD
jgi:hypothetical protein